MGERPRGPRRGGGGAPAANGGAPGSGGRAPAGGRWPLARARGALADPRARSGSTLPLLLACALAAAPGSARAQEPEGPARPAPADPGGLPFRTPIGSAIEPLHRFALAHVSRDSVSRGVALADLGDRLGFWLLRRPGGPVELAGALSAGAFSRFDLESADNEFIEVHYRVGLQLRARLGTVAARAELFHVSSHLGDELHARTGREPISTSREGVELLVQAEPVAGLAVHGGPGLLLRSSDDLASGSARLGAAWTPASAAAGRPAPYLAVEAFAWAELDWEPVLALEGGVAFGPRARFGAMLGAGPSRAEQFFRETETLVGLSFSYRR